MWIYNGVPLCEAPTKCTLGHTHPYPYRPSDKDNPHNLIVYFISVPHVSRQNDRQGTETSRFVPQMLTKAVSAPAVLKARWSWGLYGMHSINFLLTTGHLLVVVSVLLHLFDGASVKQRALTTNSDLLTGL